MFLKYSKCSALRSILSLTIFNLLSIVSIDFSGSKLLLLSLASNKLISLFDFFASSVELSCFSGFFAVEGVFLTSVFFGFDSFFFGSGSFFCSSSSSTIMIPVPSSISLSSDFLSLSIESFNSGDSVTSLIGIFSASSNWYILGFFGG
jgi:hypothetical protein